VFQLKPAPWQLRLLLEGTRAAIRSRRRSMNETWFIPLWLQLAIVAAVVAVVVVFVLPRIAQHMQGGGSWSGLAKRFGVRPREIEGAFRRQSLKVGQVLWRNCVTVAAPVDGLYLEVKAPMPFLAKPPLLIPWSQFGSVEIVRLFWQDSYQLGVGRPPIATITLSGDLYHRIAPRLAGAGVVT